MNQAGEYLWANKKDEIFYDKQKKDHFMNHMLLVKYEEAIAGI